MKKPFEEAMSKPLLLQGKEENFLEDLILVLSVVFREAK
jgi:hypothetical protein